MARKLFKVKTLRNFAFEVVYRELILDFDFIFRKEKRNTATFVDWNQQSRPLAKVSRTDFSQDYVLSQAIRNKAVDGIKKKLDENLIGKYSEERKQIVNRFVKNYRNVYQFDVDFNLCLAFLMCLLDETFIEFDLTGGEEEYHPFKHFDPSELLPVISERSPNLKFIRLSFASLELVASLIPTLCTSLLTFKCLTSLCLTSPWAIRIVIDSLPLFSSLGESCPNLIRLQLAGYLSIFFKFEHLLALVLGKKINLVPQQLILQLNANQYSLAQLQFTPQSVTPMCSSIQQLEVYGLSKEQAAFALRHFPKLQKCQTKYLEGGDGEAVRLLHQQQKQSNLIHSTTCHEFSESMGFIEWTLNAPFYGID